MASIAGVASTAALVVAAAAFVMAAGRRETDATDRTRQDRDAAERVARIEKAQTELAARLERVEAGLRAAEARARSGASPGRPAGETTAAAGPEKSPTGHLPPAREAEAAAMAERIRREAEARVRGADAEARRAVETAMAREREVMEDAARGGTMALLRGLGQRGARATELVRSAERMEPLFERKTTGPERSESSWKQHEALEDGSTILLASGRHEWDVAAYRHRGSFPKDVLVRGAGMDATLLRLNELSTNHEIHSLTFEDLTLDAGDDYLTDLRSASPVTLRLRRCRVVAFDMGAGGSVMLAAGTAAFYATDSRFEAGYGRTGAGFGNLFRVRSGLVARMERCVFNGPFRSVFDADARAAYAFVGCTFENMPGFDVTASNGADGVTFEECTVKPVADGASTRDVRRRLQDINPAW